MLGGATKYPPLKDTAEGLLRSVGLKDVVNEVEVLPGRRVGDRRFGVIRVPMALTWGKPAEGEDVQTQVLYW